jgi:hypothetical protein
MKLASKLLMPFAGAREVEKGSGVVLDGTNSSGPGNTTWNAMEELYSVAYRWSGLKNKQEP